MGRRADRSIATFVIVTLVAVVTALLVGLGTLNYMSERESQYAELTAGASTKADQMAAGLALPLWNFDRPQVDKVIESAMRDPEVYGVIVREPDVSGPGGSAVYARVRGADWKPVTTDRAFPTTGMLIEERKVTASGADLGTVIVATSPRFVEASLRRSLVSTVVRIVALDLLLVLSLWVLLTRTVIRPLRDVERYAATVSSGERGSVGGMRFYGELAGLRASIEKMVGQLDARYEALRKGEATLAGVLNSVPHSIFWKDRDGRYLGCNAVFARAAGFGDPREVVGKTDFDLPWPKADSEKYRADDRDVVETGCTKRHMVEPVRVASGMTIWVDTTKVPLVGMDGKVYGVLGVYEDVTERMEGEEALQRAKLFTEAVLDSVPGILYLYDDQGRLVRWNAKAVEITGYTPAELAGSQAGHGQSPEDKARIMAGLGKAITEGHVEMEAPLVTKAGDRIPYYYTGVRLMVDGKAYVVGIGIDIAERIRAEDALRREKIFTDAVFDNVPAVLSVYDDKGRLIRWNAKTAEITGHSDDELSRRRVGEAQPEEERGRIATAVRQVLQAGHVVMEATLLTKGGDRIPYYYTGVRVMLDGKPHILTIGMDISERKRAEAVLLESEKMRTVAGLAAGMAHEINNPLAGMLQNAQVVLNRLSPDHPANRKAAEQVGTTVETVSSYMERRGIPEMLRAIRSSGERAAEIVANMLSFSRPTTDSQVRRHRMEDVLDRAVELAYSDYDLRRFDLLNLKLVREYAGDLPDVPCRATEIQQVVLNLLKNAAQAMAGVGVGVGGGEEAPRIVVRTAREGNTARIEVEDNGPGMPEAVRQRAFEPFFTTKEPQSGTGLGLFVSYCIITRNHGGTISVESAEGKGTRFTINLPLEAEGGTT